MNNRLPFVIGSILLVQVGFGAMQTYFLHEARRQLRESQNLTERALTVADEFKAVNARLLTVHKGLTEVNEQNYNNLTRCLTASRRVTP